jgi:hypothetical protein
MSALVTGQIDHAGHGPVPTVVRRFPDVLIDPQGHDPVQPGRVTHALDRLDLDRVPGCVPAHPEVTGQRRDRGVVVGQSVGGPSDRPGRQLGPRIDQAVGLGERADRAAGVRTSPDPLAPGNHHLRPERRRVVCSMDPPPVTDRDHPTDPAPRHQLVGLDCHHHLPAAVVVHVDHMQAGGIEHLIGTGAPGRTVAASTIRHVGVSKHQSAWSLLILEAPTLLPLDHHTDTALNHAEIRPPRPSRSQTNRSTTPE